MEVAGGWELLAAVGATTIAMVPPAPGVALIEVVRLAEGGAAAVGAGDAGVLLLEAAGWLALVAVGPEPLSPGLLPHPVPPVGTRLTAGSLPLCSDFKLGRLAGGRRAYGNLPRFCMPCLRGSVFLC